MLKRKTMRVLALMLVAVSLLNLTVLAAEGDTLIEPEEAAGPAAGTEQPPKSPDTPASSANPQTENNGSGNSTPPAEPAGQATETGPENTAETPDTPALPDQPAEGTAPEPENVQEPISISGTNRSGTTSASSGTPPFTTA